MNKERYQKRRLFKKNAREVVRHHYFVLVMLCLVAIYFGAEFRYVTSQTNDTYNILTGKLDPRNGTGQNGDRYGLHEGKPPC